MIQVMSEHISFQDRLSLVLPLLQKAFVVEKEEQVNTSKVKVKALEVMLSLFKELETYNTDGIDIGALDYKVFSVYIMPFI